MTHARCMTRRFVVALLSLAPAMQDAWAADTQEPAAPRERVTQFIVKVKAQAAHESGQATLARRAVERALLPYAEKSPTRMRRAAEPVAQTRPMSGAAHVVTLGMPITDEAAAVIAERLRAQPEIEYAEPDYLLHRQLIPTDPLYAKQWAYRDGIGAARFESAWDVTTGRTGMVVAVVDSGYRPHADLVANLLPGYDFISDPFYANDGDGRDADASDPGDWVTADESLKCDGTDRWVGNSAWHGTHVAGTIGAVANNEIGGAGGVWSARVLPVRVLGKCGGPVSDIVDALRWAVGMTVPGVPVNPHPAKVVNISLGTARPCGVAMQAAIDDVLAHGASVVAAAGNDGFEVGEPASCRGAIAVAAVDANGNKGAFSNSGERIDVGAPGVDILSTANAGLTVPGEDSLRSRSGTSMAAPHVSAAVALMLAVEPKLTPEEIRGKIRATARAYPAGSNCGNTNETLSCGTGMLDAAAAVAAARAAMPPGSGAADSARDRPTPPKRQALRLPRSLVPSGREPDHPVRAFSAFELAREP